MSLATIVVPLLDRLGELEPILDFLHEEKPDQEILFMDRGSMAISVDLVQTWVQNHPNAQLYMMPEGSTPGATYNKALEFVKTPYMIVLRHHTLPTQDDWVQQLVDIAEADQDLGCLAPLCLDTRHLSAMTGILYLRGLPQAADQGQPLDEPRIQRSWDFKSFKDSCLLLRVEALQKIGGFDDRYVLTHYDYDLGIRLYSAGYRNRYVPQVIMRYWGQPWNPENERSGPDPEAFWIARGGINGMDALTDVKEYFGTGYNFPAIEQWSNHEIPEKKGKIVCFLADHDGCGSYRIKNPYRGLIFRGWDVTFTTYADNSAIDWADIVVLQRQMAETSIELLEYALSANKPVIYEVDDFFHALHESNPVTPQFYQQPGWLRNMEKMIYRSSALTVSTPELQRQYGRFNTNTHLIQNHIDLGAIPQPIKMNDTDTIRIGWAGSGTHDSDIPLVAEALDQVLRENPKTTLVFIGADYRSLFPNVALNRMEWMPPSFGREIPVDDYYGILNDARLDIGLAPIEDTLFNRCKSDIKLVEYGAYGIASVASDVEPYSNFAKMAKHDVYGKPVLLARCERDWYKHITRLVQHPEVVIAVGRAAQQYVWLNRGVDKMCDQIEALCQSLLDGKRHTPYMDEPAHSLNVTYFNNLSAKQASEQYKLWMEQRETAQASPAA